MAQYALASLILAFVLPALFLLFARAFGRHPREFSQVPIVMAGFILSSALLAYLSAAQGDELGRFLLNINTGIGITVVILAIGGVPAWLHSRVVLRRQAGLLRPDRRGSASELTGTGGRETRARSETISDERLEFDCEPQINLDAGKPTSFFWDGSDSVFNAVLPNNAYTVAELRIDFTVTSNSVEVLALGIGAFRAWYHWFLLNLPAIGNNREARAEAKGLVRCDRDRSDCKITGLGNKDKARDVEFSTAAIVVAKPREDEKIELAGTGGVAFLGQQTIGEIKITGKVTLERDDLKGEAGVEATLNFPKNADKDQEKTRNVIYECGKISTL